MTLLHFYIVCGITLATIVLCMVINNAQYHSLKRLIAFLSETVKQNLILNGEPGKARKISLDEVPQFESWFNECKNYGWINLLGLGSIIALIVSGVSYHTLSLVPCLLSVLFLAINIIFLPKAFSRLNKSIDTNNGYVMLIKTFEKAQELKSVDPQTPI